MIETFLVTLDRFKIKIDFRPRPHYIILGKEKMYGTFPSSPDQFISDLRTALIKFKKESLIMSIHLGYYRTSNDFHVHLISSDLKTFTRRWKNEHSQSKFVTKGLDILNDWTEKSKKTYHKYKQFDLKNLKPISISSKKLNQKSSLFYFNSHRPIIHLFEHNDLNQIYHDLVELSTILDLDRKSRGGHICIQRKNNGYLGWLQVDIQTYYSIHPNNKQWLNNYKNDPNDYIQT